MSTLKVNAIRGTGASSDAISVNSTDGTCTANLTNPRSFRNLVINGAMNVAQRGTSSTSSGFGSLDRWKHEHGGQDEAPTYSQHALTSSDTGPWEKGFRNSFHILNGNQTGGAGASDYIQCGLRIEAQDIAQSGWEYNSTSSDITLSCWVKSSVAQAFPFTVVTDDGTSYKYAFTTGSLSANTWTKVTKTIPGNSNLTFNNDNGKGLTILFWPFMGTTWTGTTTENVWFTGGDYCNDITSTWWTTNDATFEITGLQLEVGDVATDFEHRSYGDELLRCQRYYVKKDVFSAAIVKFTTSVYFQNFWTEFPVRMRVAPSSWTGGSIEINSWSSSSSCSAGNVLDYNIVHAEEENCRISARCGSGSISNPANNPGDANMYSIRVNDCEFSAEL